MNFSWIRILWHFLFYSWAQGYREYCRLLKQPLDYLSGWHWFHHRINVCCWRCPLPVIDPVYFTSSLQSWWLKSSRPTCHQCRSSLSSLTGSKAVVLMISDARCHRYQENLLQAPTITTNHLSRDWIRADRGWSRCCPFQVRILRWLLRAAATGWTQVIRREQL